MRQFKDNAGRTWTVDINVATLKSVRGLTGVDLMQVIEGTLIEKFIRDPVLCATWSTPSASPRQTPPRSPTRSSARRWRATPSRATTGGAGRTHQFLPEPEGPGQPRRVLQATNRVLDKARDLTEKRIETLTSESGWTSS